MGPPPLSPPFPYLAYTQDTWSHVTDRVKNRVRDMDKVRFRVKIG